MLHSLLLPALPMTKRKNGLACDDSQQDGVTSLCNTSDGADKRTAALQISQAKQRSQRYETVTILQLADWPEKVSYSALTGSLQAHVIEYYMWGQLHGSSTPYSSLAEYTQQFNALAAEQKDACANRVCDIHTVIEYTLRTQVLPEYLDYHTTGGDLSKHWESIPTGSAVHRRRQRTVKRMQNMAASQLVPGAPGLLVDHYGWSLDLSGTTATAVTQICNEVYVCRQGSWNGQKSVYLAKGVTGKTVCSVSA